MNDSGITITLELDSSGDTLNGQASTGAGTTRTFSSWLGMIGALDLLVDGGGVQPASEMRAGTIRIAR